MRTPPAAEVYEQEFDHWPWGEVIAWIADVVAVRSPPGAALLDYMSGTGTLVRRILALRPDMSAVGCDLSPSFDGHARERSPLRATFVCEDALVYRPLQAPDIITATGALHHLPFERQGDLLAKIARELAPGGRAILAEESIGPHRNEVERKCAALHHGATLIRLGIERRWSDAMLDVAIEVLRGDVLLEDEYKRSTADWIGQIEQHLVIERTQRLWTTDVGGGDVVFVCKARP